MSSSSSSSSGGSGNAKDAKVKVVPCCSFLKIALNSEFAQSMKKGWAEHTWPRGIITVGFVPGYDYSEKNEELVIKYINEAYNFLGVKFKPQHLDWKDEKKYDANLVLLKACMVRVVFRWTDKTDPQSGSWSLVGKNCVYSQDLFDFYPVPGGPSTHFGWPITTPYGRATVIHEFGHVLGLGHEHQHPNRRIVFDEAKTVVVFGEPPNSWSPDDVAIQILNLAHPDKKQTDPYDKESVMHYSFPQEILVVPKRSWKPYEEYKYAYEHADDVNYDLSDGDKKFLARLYPQEEHKRHEVITTDPNTPDVPPPTEPTQLAQPGPTTVTVNVNMNCNHWHAIAACAIFVVGVAMGYRFRP